MISLLDSNNKLNEHKNSLNITYPRTVNIIFGHFPYIEIINNLIIEIKNNLEPNLQNFSAVQGGMTKWEYFLNNKNFDKFITYLINTNQTKHSNLFQYFYEKNYVFEAWGNEIKKGDSVDPHVHSSHHCILYLTKGSDLILPELNIKISPNPGDYYIFPPETLHSVNPSDDEFNRYSLVFNFNNHVLNYREKLKNGKKSRV
jgi:hypothetical protein